MTLTPSLADIQELAGQQALEIGNLKLMILALNRQIRELQVALQAALPIADNGAKPNRAARRRAEKEESHATE